MWRNVEKLAKKAEEVASDATKMVTVTTNAHIQSVQRKVKAKTKKVTTKVKTHFSSHKTDEDDKESSTPTKTNSSPSSKTNSPKIKSTNSPKTRRKPFARIQADADGLGDKSEIHWESGSIGRMPSLRVFGKDTTIVVADEHKSERTTAEDTIAEESTHSVGTQKVNLPILIFPGMASSGLYVQESGLHEKYKGRRLWMNAGFLAASKVGSIDVNSSQKHDANMSSYIEDDNDSSRNPFAGNIEDLDRDNSTRSTATDVETDETVAFAKIENEFQIRSAWLYHVSLDKNLVDERPGNKVRPYDGFKACEWLVDDKIGKPAAVVWADTIQFLEREMGYIRGKNLDAVPYDWRLPPMCTEARDGYLTQTMEKVEKMYHDNGGLPIVMCCHSMGSRMGHYFLNFCLREKGRAWIDKHIHTYMPVGAPHCGAPLTMRLAATGAGLIGFVEDSLISLDEGLIMYRSWGSGPWLASRELPSGILPNCIVRREGELGIKINSEMDVGSLFAEREKPPRELRLTIVFRDKIYANTEFVPVQIDPSNPASMTVAFDATFYFAVPHLGDQNETIGDLVFFLEGPSSGMLYSQTKTRARLRHATRWARGFKKEISKMYRGVTKKLGSVLRVGVCERPLELNVSTFADTSSVTMEGAPVIESIINFCEFKVDEIEVQNKGQNERRNSAEVPLIMNGDHEGDEKEEFAIVPYDFDNNQEDDTIGSLSIHIRYTPPPDFENQPSTCAAKFAVMSEDTPIPPIVSRKRRFNTVNHDSIVYEAWHGKDLLDQDGFCQGLFDVFREYYDQDDLGPSTKSALEAPPVNCVRSIYGINVPTEVCVVYRKEPVVTIGDSKADCRYRVDTSAAFPKLSSNDESNPEVEEMMRGYQMKDGIINETSETLQQVPGTNEQRRCCGDGTVPYWSMVHCLNWKDSIPTVTVDELEGAIHRSILSDKRFHALMQQHCTVDDPRVRATPW